MYSPKLLITCKISNKSWAIFLLSIADLSLLIFQNQKLEFYRHVNYWFYFCTIVIDITDWLWLRCWCCYCDWCHFIKPSSLIDIIFTQRILFFIGNSKYFLQNLLVKHGFNLKSFNFYVFQRACHIRFRILSYLCPRLKAFFAYSKIQKRAEVRSFPYRYLYRIGIFTTSWYSIEVPFRAS